ncbi:TonB-dependent receptor [Terriglobus sp. 2YAB30_2]|uniref:TonB-dependent receptor domain-containing protein n=2 Tax=unclassified Terriglobus TaxID=2628988 RepID=UPI003F9B6398
MTAETVNQFKVITSSPGAQFGRSSGGFLNIVSKQGGNKFHGDIYEFFRNDQMNAADFFQKRSGTVPFVGRNDFRPPLRFNQFGGFVSGPVMIPGIHHGDPATFFTFGYEGIRKIAYARWVLTVPTVLMRQGILTENTDVVYDPYSTHLVGTTYTRTPLPAGCNAGGCFAAGKGVVNINPVAKALLDFYPLPTKSGIASNYSHVQRQTDVDDQYNFRIDHNFSERQRVFARGTYSVNKHRENDWFDKPTGSNAVYQPISAYLFALGDTWTFSPNMLLQVTYGFANQRNQQISGSYGIDPRPYGFSSNFLSEQQTPGIPYLIMTSFSTLGYLAGSNRWDHYTHSLAPLLTWQKGTHTLNVGYDGRLIYENEPSFANPLGTFTFSNLLTRGPNAFNAPAANPSQFDAFASFLLGVPSDTHLVRNAEFAMHQWYNSVFIQDDWRLARNLTLNLGVRYEHEGAMRERHNQWASIDLNATNPFSTSSFPFTGGAQYVGANGNSAGFWQDYNRVSPRVGLAFSPYTGTAVRAGYNMLFLPTSQRIYSSATMGYTQDTAKTYAFSDVPTTTMDNPLPNGVALPAGASAGVQVSTGNSVSGLLYHNPQAYIQQWNFGVEQELATGLVLHLNYAGSKGTHLPINSNPNDLQPKDWGAVGDPGGTQAAYLAAAVPNPFYGKAAASSQLNTATVRRQQLLAAYPQYALNTGLTNNTLALFQNDIGTTSYNAFQAYLTVRRVKNLVATVALTWSKLLGNVSDYTTGGFNQNGIPAYQNYYRMDIERSYLPTDVPQRFVATGNYTLPFGRGQRFGSNVRPWVNEFLGGWKLNTIVFIQSGFPLDLTETGGAAYSGSRPSFVPGVNPLTQGPVKNRLGGGTEVGYFNPNAFRPTRAFELGDVPRASGLMRSPFHFQDDLSFIKEFRFRERYGVQFRFEAYNFLNKVQFGQPTVTYGSTTFGQISSQSNQPRSLQLALKLSF